MLGTVNTRYVVAQLPDQSGWAILDRHLMGFCTLPDARDPSTLLPLEWKHQAAAEAWLNQCYRIWHSWEQERSRNVPTIPDNWRRPVPRPSPWSAGAEAAEERRSNLLGNPWGTLWDE